MTMRRRRANRILLILCLVAVKPAISLSPWKVYKAWLIQNPVLTKSLTAGALATCSDVLAQSMEGPSDEAHDYGRSLQVATTGIVYSGPMTHVWYQFMETTLLPSVLKTPTTKFTKLVTRLLLDAALFSPITILGYFVTRTLLEGKGLVVLQEKLHRAFLSTLVFAWKFWPVVNIFNFLYVPLPYRVLYVNIMSLLWTGYLSLTNSRASKK